MLARVVVELSAMLPLVRNCAMLLFFSGTMFVHGYVLLGGLYRILPLRAFLAVAGAYAVHVATCRAQKTGRWRSHAFLRSDVVRAPVEFFKMAVVGAERRFKLKPTERSLWCLHPHGIFPMSGLLLYSAASPLRKLFPWLLVRPCGASVLFRVPFLREYLLLTGHLDASRSTMTRLMAKGDEDLGLVIGGNEVRKPSRNDCCNGASRVCTTVGNVPLDKIWYCCGVENVAGIEV